MKSVLSLIAILLVGAVNPSHAADTEEGFTTIFDGKTIIEYNEPPVNPTGGGKKLGEGTFALQAHDPKSIARYKNIRVKRLE